MATSKKTITQPVGEIVPVLSGDALKAAIDAGTPGIGGVVWEGWGDALMAQGVSLGEQLVRVWKTLAAGAYMGGLRSEMLVGPQKATATTAAKAATPCWVELERRIASFMTLPGVRFIPVEPGTVGFHALSGDDIKARNAAIKALSGHRQTIIKYLREFDTPEERGARPVRTPDHIVRDSLMDVLDYIRKTEHDWKLELEDFFDPVKEVVSAFDAVLGRRVKK